MHSQIMGPDNVSGAQHDCTGDLMSSRREYGSLFQGLGPNSGVPSLSKGGVECTCLSFASDNSIKASMNL